MGKTKTRVKPGVAASDRRWLFFGGRAGQRACGTALGSVFEEDSEGVVDFGPEESQDLRNHQGGI